MVNKGKFNVKNVNLVWFYTYLINVQIQLLRVPNIGRLSWTVSVTVDGDS